MGVLTKRTAVVTGAASGIGYATARTIAQEGAHVLLSDIHEANLAHATQMLQDEGLDVTSYVGDASKETDVERMLEEAQAQHGSLDIVVNNAGTQLVAAIEEFPVDRFTQMIHLMLIGPFIAIKHAFPIMKRQRYGRIINMASINGLIGFAGKAAYNSAKHGIIGLTRVASLEGAHHGITVNALCPGYVDTPLVRNQLQDIATSRGVPLEQVLEDIIYPLVPQRRLLNPQEIADYTVFLSSNKARGITGQAVVIDGGYVAQ